MEVLIGTYEEFVIGVRFNKEDDDKYTAKQTFTDHSQCGSIRCIAVAGKFLASGSTDESIKVYDLKKRVDYGNLQKHNGTVTCIDGYKSSHLISGSDDGTICIWRTRGWECDRTLLAAHKGGVTSLSIHPSGKLALSVGKDRGLKTWNLIKARTAYVKNLHAVGDIVLWSPDGQKYVVVVDTTINIYSTEVAGVIHTVKTQGRIHGIAFVNEHLLAVASEAPEVEFHDLAAKASVSSFRAHDKRVKTVSYVKVGDDDFLITGSSDGQIKLWKIKVEDLTEKPKLLCQHNIGCRITCMSVWKGHATELTEDEKKLKLEEEMEENVSDQEQEIIISEVKTKPQKIKQVKRNKKRQRTEEPENASILAEPENASILAEPAKAKKVKTKKRKVVKSLSGNFQVDER